MHAERERWANRGVFIIAAVGAAIGLGNVWRFPYKVYQSGGGAFLIPYFVALFVAGIPLLIMEFGLGQYFQGAAPKAFNRIRPSFEGIGWWAIGISALIAIYYCVILAHAWNYLFLSIGKSWGADPGSFYSDVFLKKTSGPHIQGQLCLPIVGGLALSWIAIALSIYKGIGRVGKVVMFTVPLPALLLVVMFLRGITLPGASEGIALYLNPDFSRLADPHIWLLAFSQVFFSVGLGWGIMIAYASYRSKSAEINNSAFITCLSDVGLSFFGGFAVFSALGFLTHDLTGAELTGTLDAIGSGSSLAFIAYPLLINELGLVGSLFGVIFFLMLLTLGIDSAFALQEAFTAGFHDKWKIPHGKLTLGFVLIAFPISLIFTTRGGYYWFDIVDKWICDFGLVTVGLGQCLIVGYIFGISGFRRHLNGMSEVRLGRWWEITLCFFTPAVLIVILVMNVLSEIGETYEGYPRWATSVAGWGTLILFAAVGYLLWRRRGRGESS